MKISDLISVLEDMKNENGDLDVTMLLEDSVFELDSESIEIVEKEQGGNVVAINLDSFFDDSDEDELEPEAGKEDFEDIIIEEENDGDKIEAGKEDFEEGLEEDEVK